MQITNPIINFFVKQMGLIGKIRNISQKMEVNRLRVNGQPFSMMESRVKIKEAKARIQIVLIKIQTVQMAILLVSFKICHY